MEDGCSCRKNDTGNITRVLYCMENSAVISSIKKGFMLLIPILLTGSLAVFLRSFPIPWFQEKLAVIADGNILKIINFIYDSTIGFMSVLLVFGISYYYSAYFAEKNMILRILSMMNAFICFLASFGAASGSLTLESFSMNGIFTAIVCAILSTRLFFLLELRLYKGFRSYVAGADIQFRSSMTSILPILTCVIIFSAANLFLTLVFHVNNLNELVSNLLQWLFSNLEYELANGLLFAFLLNLLWSFGIHGGNALDPVSNLIFSTTAQDQNMIITKDFLNNFSLIGGCGTTVCLFFALIFVSRSKSNRELAYISAPLAIFNINETLVFGIPIVFNSIFLIPFILVPMISLCIAYLAVAVGFMPVVHTTVSWTTPVLFSGYLLTDSFRGVVVQLLIIIIGTVVYIPFVKFSERFQSGNSVFLLKQLIADFFKEELSENKESYLNRNDNIGLIAKAMVVKLHQDIEMHKIPVYYQPLMNSEEKLIGAEALLRWNYSDYPIPPPLVITVAKEDGCLDQLTWCILENVCRDIPIIEQKLGHAFRVSVNIIPEQLDDIVFVQRVISVVKEANLISHLVLEVTENTSLNDLKNITTHVALLKSQGIMMAIDDFSMGQTSLSYLKNNDFLIVKLDGGLVRQITENKRCQDIVSSIITLGNSLQFQVTAEYVENEATRQILLKLGCQCFQGYLYSPAIPIEQFLEFEENRKKAV